MNLLSLDQAVWQDILSHWLGSLGQVVRLDFAVGGVTDKNNQFRDIFGKLAVSLPANVCVTPDLLLGLYSWMKLRNVYLSAVEVTMYWIEWEEVFTFCRSSLKKLRICGTRSGQYCKNIAHFLHTASIHCRCLQELALENGTDQDGRTLCSILRNNAFTLVVLTVKGLFGEDCPICLDDISCPSLQVLSWQYDECAEFGDFLQRCPNLSALSLMCVFTESILSALAQNFPRLKQLRLNSFNRLDAVTLLRIARGCRRLEYLDVFSFEGSLVEIIQELPHLHTLHTHRRVPEFDWLEIAKRGIAPSLHVLDVGSKFSCTGFRQFTAASPHLTGLSVQIIGLDINLDNTTLFAHCAALKHLEIDMYKAPKETVDAMLESVALCCPSLEVLDLTFETLSSNTALQNILDSCTNLKYLVNHHIGEGLQIPSTVVVAEEGPPLTQWMPAV